MKEFFYERIGEAVCRERLTNGLEVCVVPKPGYAKKYAFFSTRYGGAIIKPGNALRGNTVLLRRIFHSGDQPHFRDQRCSSKNQIVPQQKAAAPFAGR